MTEALDMVAVVLPLMIALACLWWAYGRRKAGDSVGMWCALAVAVAAVAVSLGMGPGSSPR